MEYASQPLLMQVFNFNSKTIKKFFVTAVYDNKKATNKGAVEASDGNTPEQKKMILRVF
ncbi:hypothetical protein [Halpernia frigidisoli]|uniref:Uncharacterized protein n=1 Tax=Halpernia frigidisoli TaxID=1125876 RepID=A0A1I3IPP1_9FLAO|nr:hypothetical protein [Halpernia frigidisoli]SFI49948.1 hypothetical protein SAMN05443292_2727 [Halpernia frigidisoli]